MNVGQVFQLFRQYCDAPDTTFLTDSDVVTYLNLGYNEYRTVIQQIDPQTFSKSVVITVNGNSYDLDSASANAVTLLGSAPKINGANTQPMIMLLNVRYTDATGGNRGRILKMVSNLRTLETDYECVALLGTVLNFSITISGTVLLTYVEEPDITWASGGTAFIDNFGMFHDLIALYAYKQYAIRAAAANPVLLTQLETREQHLRAHILSMRQEANQYVNRTDTSYDYI